MECPRCDAALAEGQQFCTSCGLRLEAEPAVGGRPGGAVAVAPAPEFQLVRCPACGGVNAASRARCGRCRAELRAAGAGVGAVADAGAPADEADAAGRWRRGTRPESSGLLLVGVVMAGLVAVGVVLVALGARGLGLFDRTGGAGALPASDLAAIEASAASSTLQASDPAAAVDGSVDTAWFAGVASPGEWLELELQAETVVRRLEVRTGAPDSGAGRVHRLDIALGDRLFEVVLRDDGGGQRIVLPEAVPALRVRMTVQETYGDAPAAVREVAVFADGPVTPAASKARRDHQLGGGA